VPLANRMFEVNRGIGGSQVLIARNIQQTRHDRRNVCKQWAIFWPYAVEKGTQLSRRNCRFVLFRWASIDDHRAGLAGERRIRSMNWFRSSLRSFAYIALFALALQVVVSFGHVHRDDLGLPLRIQAGQAGILILTDETGRPTGPADRDHYPASDQYCPICASIALIATGAPSLPPILVVPESVLRFSPSEKPTHDPRPQFALSFQARGPPIV
jgi:hypothetical protein